MYCTSRWYGPPECMAILYIKLHKSSQGEKKKKIYHPMHDGSFRELEIEIRPLTTISKVGNNHTAYPFVLPGYLLYIISSRAIEYFTILYYK
jgi:hypothetical protein